ncbi:MAG: hypothetical protein CBB97_03335 [Candidatus Endolissoclinum sp. TMED37]|nr:MAG: hypothetical protein CBB97_03335 [Candidatus Endolissoclinum sp. TMED37]
MVTAFNNQVQRTAKRSANCELAWTPIMLSQRMAAMWATTAAFGHIAQGPLWAVREDGPIV